MNKSFNFNDDVYTARIRVVTHKQVELIPTSDVSVWRGQFYNHMVDEHNSSRKDSLEKCHTILVLAISCCASSVRVSCSADITGISIIFDFNFDSAVNLDAFKEGLDRKSMKDDNKKPTLKF